MRLRHIEVFYAVYSCGSVTRAAEVLKVSQPSISKVLAHAEQQLGFALFNRVRGKLVPTSEANQLFVQVAHVNDDVDRLRQLAANLRLVEKGTIRVAAQEEVEHLVGFGRLENRDQAGDVGGVEF